MSLKDSEILTGLVNSHAAFELPLIKEELATLRKYAAIARAVESGEWKLVPKFLTDDMRDAMHEAGYSHDEHWEGAIAAAPQFQEE